MKRLLFLGLALVLITMNVYADVGDVAATLYNSDILTLVHGLEIDSFSLDGEMLIKAEDLRDYGYTVTYDDAVRSLFINKTGEINEDFCPDVKRGTVGGIFGFTYESDIGVYYNGSFINSYSLDGEMAIKVEELGCHHGLTYSYDDSKRLLTLDNGMVGTKEEQIQDTLTLSEELSFLSRGLRERLSGDGFDVISYFTGGMPRPQTNYEYYDDNGKIVFLDGIFNRYGFHDGWGRTLISDMRLCGNALKFKGESNKNRENLNFPEGDYVLDLCTHTISPSPVGSIATPTGFDIEINGIGVLGYNLGGRPFIDSGVLEAFGFLKNGTDYTPGEGDLPTAVLLDDNVTFGKIADCDTLVTVNGKAYETYAMDGRLLINADDIAIKERNITPNGFSGRWDSENNKLIISIGE